MSKRILTYLVLPTLIISCSKGKPHHTAHPDQGAVVVTADWSGKSSEADIPQKYVLRIADVKQEVSGEHVQAASGPGTIQSGGVQHA